ncbi:MAG TPA: type II secretion system minor pseudopilin GspK [Burkholderiales bacterium]|jgi:general secretion pathway protein K
MTSPRLQSGAAVIIALLVLALAAASAAAMLERQDVDARALQSQRDYEQARWMLRGGMHWARSILAEDARASATDHQRELWASGLPPTDVQIGSLAGAIRDEQALFNLNNLLRAGKPDPQQVEALRRLLATIGLAPALADAIAARMDPSRPLVDVGELAGMSGLGMDAMVQLRRYATALPIPTPVNVNTAPAEVLAALVEGLALPEAQALARRLATEPVRTRDEFQARLRPGLKLSLESVSASSQFFVVQGRAKVGDADLRMEALLQRTGTGFPTIVWQRNA